MAARLPTDGANVRLPGTDHTRPNDEAERLQKIIRIIVSYIGIFFFGRAAAAYLKREEGFAI
jgi:hypothetical protein